MKDTHEVNASGAPATLALPPDALLGHELSSAIIAFHDAIARQLGLGAAEWKCLGILYQYGPITAGRLARRSGFTTGAITGIVDRLERVGYLQRQPHPRDRRSTVIQPLRVQEVTDQVAPIFASLAEAMAGVSAHYTPAEQAAIRDYLERTIEVLRQQVAALSA